MAIQTINLGNYANDGTGDDLRTAFLKVNANFNELTSTINVNSANNIGDGTGLFYQKNVNVLEFKTLTSIDNSVIITHDNSTVDLKATPNIVDDTSPELGGNLNLNNHYIYGGDVQTTVFGIDPRANNSMIELLIASNALTVDFGSFLVPTGTSGQPGDKGFLLDMNGLYNGTGGFSVADTGVPDYDFGTFN